MSNTFSNNNAKETVKTIYNHNFNKVIDYYNIVGEGDRTTLSLIYHENIVDVIDSNDIDTYSLVLNNYCFCDYVDRFIFQKQLWELSEYTGLIKIFCNNLHISNIKKKPLQTTRFTKILTKYSSEYNNYMFIIRLCNTLLILKKHLYYYINYQPNNITTKDKDRYNKYYAVASIVS